MYACIILCMRLHMYAFSLSDCVKSKTKTEKNDKRRKKLSKQKETKNGTGKRLIVKILAWYHWRLCGRKIN